MTRAVVFDFFGVICPDLAALTGAEFARRHGIDHVEFSRLGDACRADLDHGRLTQAQFAAVLIKQFQLDASPAQLVEEFKRLDGHYYAFNHELYDLIEVLKPQATVALMSNVSRDEGAYLRSLGAYKPFDHVFLSDDFGLTKSDVAWFEQVAGELNLAPEHVLLIDDGASNVATAQAAGWSHSVKYNDPNQLRTHLRELGFQV